MVPSQEKANINEQDNVRSRALLIGVEIRGSRPLFTIEDSLDELARLAETAGVEVKGREVQRLQQIVPSTFIGSGKLQEILELLPALGANMVIFDDELSPRHQRELEKAFGEDIRVLDRSALILDIFAQHASTREGALQVELAQYEYRLPRLTRQWSHLARQAGGGAARGGSGGVGLRGPGETQLEVDRREIGRKIATLKKELESVREHRERHRARRERAGIPTVALVGYTNAGKSTLLNALTESDVYVADQLFATLDPTTRRVTLPSGRGVLLTDTVGFIQKLPVNLVAAFRATLEEVSKADALLHVVDSNHSDVSNHIEVVEDTLAELDATRIPKVLALNKIDISSFEHDIDVEALGYQAAIRISGKRRLGLDVLLAALDDVLADNMVTVTLLIPYTQGDILAAIHRTGIVVSENHVEEGVEVIARVSDRLAGRLDHLLARS